MKKLLFAALVGMAAGAPFTTTDLTVCSKDADCQMFGDAGATCCTDVTKCPAPNTNKCTCTTTGTTPYAAFTYSVNNNVVSTCMRVADSDALKAATQVTAVVTLNYNAGDCSQINTFRTEYIQTIQGYFQSTAITVDAIEHSCATTGSNTGVFTAMKLSLTIGDLVSTRMLDFPDNAINLLTTTNLQLLGTTIGSQRLMLAEAVPAYCTLPATGITTLQGFFGGTNCRDITCSTGYVVSAGTCVADTGSTFTADNVHVCSTHADCRVFGDPYAACVVPDQLSATASCVCSAGYSHHTEGAATFGNCFPTAAGTLANGLSDIDVMITMTFPVADCVGLDAVSSQFLDEIESIFDSEPTMAVKLITHHCSTPRVVTSPTHLSVDTSIKMRMKVRDLFVGAFTQFPGTVLTRIITVSALDNKFGRQFSYKGAYFLPSITRFCPDSKETKLRSHFGSQSAVTVAGAVATATPICKDMLCNEPYVSDINGVCNIPSPPFTNDSDDELTGGEIAAVVVVCFIVLVIVLAVIIYRCCVKGDDSEELKEEGA